MTKAITSREYEHTGIEEVKKKEKKERKKGKKKERKNAS